MRDKIKLTFFIVLISYIGILSSGSYVSVYITYFAIPLLVVLGLIGFGKFARINETASKIFYFALFLTIITVVSVSYVGVYLLYILLPILGLSGLIMFLSKSKS